MTRLALVLVLLLPPGDPVADGDVHRSPGPAAECYRRWQAGKAHHDWVEKHQPWKTDWKGEALYLSECWHALHELKTTAGNCTWKTLQLAQLRVMIGKREYELGIMPDFIPEWRFVDQ